MIDAAVELVVAADPAAAAEAAGLELGEAARLGGHIALAGGSTPRLAYELAARERPDWSSVELWWGDERCVSPDDPRSNFHMVQESLLGRIEVQPAAVHRIRGELGGAEAAERYDAELGGVRLGFVLLGLGVDGHTASLFPGDAALGERERLAVAVARADVERVTLTLPALNAAARILFLAVGADKAEAAERAFSPSADPATPASLVRAAGGRTVVVLDEAAAARLR